MESDKKENEEKSEFNMQFFDEAKQVVSMMHTAESTNSLMV